MRNKGEHLGRAKVLLLAVVSLMIGMTPFLASSGLASAQAAVPSWSFTGSLNTPRFAYTATLLPNGKVLVTGGSNADGILASSELYDPSTGTWSPTGNLNAPRIYHSATLLQNGKVLVAGGCANSCDQEFTDNTAELYDPATGRWSLTGSLNARRIFHTATLLSNGTVLFAGGGNTSTAELYNPGTGTWNPTGSLNETRVGHAATLLQDGKVLVVGGCSDFQECFVQLGSAELYDPNTGAWSNTGSLNRLRDNVNATTLLNGNVLAAGGVGDTGDLSSAELYSPATGRWSYTGSLVSHRGGAPATLLPSGQVLIAGGSSRSFVHDTAALYDPATGNWHETASLNTERYLHTATLLLNGKVLVVGGYGRSYSLLQSAELYDSGGSSTSSPTPTPTPTPTATPTATPTPIATPTLRANGKIAFTSDRDGNREIYVMNADGTNQVRLTNNSVVDDHPTWSPDGTKIAFVSEKSSGGFAIFVMTADGTNKVEITPIVFNATNPIWDAWGMSWSPDGNRIVFQEKVEPSPYPGYPNDIFIVNIDGSNRQILVDDPVDARQPSWSPDGSRILFVSQRVSAPFYHHLYTVRPDGSDLQRLAGVADETDLSPTWSPTGDKIAFHIFDYANLENIGIANADGSERYWFDSGSVNPDWGGRDKPDWSPDGSKIVFHVTGPPERGTQIYVKDVDGTGLTRLTNLPGNNFKPSWQPLAPTACPNPIDCADFFVRQHYRDFLGREPDAAGLAFWTNEITSCGAGQQCIDAKRINVSAAFFLSIEFQQTGYLVYRIYKAAYGNLPGAPVPLRFSEFLPDTQEIGQGVIVNQAGWETVLENNKQAFSAEFVQRSRFTSVFPTSLTPEQFVDQLFTNAGVSPSATDRTAALNEFGSATTTTDPAARSRALRRVAENSTLAQQEFNRAFVLMQYFGYLHRNPNDPPELTLDFQGYNFWLTKLNQFNGDYSGAEMVKAFIISGEYRQRFDP